VAAVVNARGEVLAGAAAAVPRRARRLRAGGPLVEVARKLHAVLTSGHRALGYNVQGACSVVEVIEDDETKTTTRRAPPDLRLAELADDCARRAPLWRPARSLTDGVLTPRRFTSHVLAQHLAGEYWVAAEAPAWVEWVALDIDAHPDQARDGALAGPRARERAERVLASVWRALRCSSTRQPGVFRSPGGGFHVWIALSRGAGAGNGETTWPAWFVRAWFSLVLRERGVDVSPGRCEVYPAGRRLRAPCGARMELLQPRNPDNPDDLRLIRWEGTYGLREERGDQAQRDQTHVRRVVPLVETFLAAYEASRRPLDEWLGRPEAAWDRAWGFLLWRADRASKNADGSLGGEEQSQQRDDVPPGGHAEDLAELVGGAVKEAEGIADLVVHPDPDPEADHLSDLPPDPDPDLPPAPAGELVRGRAWRNKVNHLVTRGLTSAGRRHDAVLALTFYYGAECGLSREATLQRLEDWCMRHTHAGSVTLAEEGRSAFVKVCRAEAANYFDGYAHRWPRRGGGVPCAPLADREWEIVALAHPSVRDEVAVLLSWLAGNADAAGIVGAPVELAGGLVAALCPERRVLVDGSRRRAAAVAVEELLRLGVMTLHRKHWAGCHGRIYKVWHRFGASVPPAAHQTRQEAPGGAKPAALVVAERRVPEGTLRAWSAGTTAPAWVKLDVDPDVTPPAVPGARAPWWVRLYTEREFTVEEFWYGDDTVIPLPHRERVRYPWMRPRPSTLPPGAPAPAQLTLAVPAELVPLLPGGLVSAVDGAWRAWARRDGA
jgi:hypothetical protein